MKALEFLEAFDQERRDAAVLGSSGISGALWQIGHRPRTLYNMGMSYTAAAALGLALARPDLPVVALEGDGSYLMGLPTLATIGRYVPPNLTVVVFNNRTYLPTGTSGELVSAAATNADLAAYARASGIPHAETCDTAEEFARALRGAQDLHGPSVVIANTEVERQGWRLGKAAGTIPGRTEAAQSFRREIGWPDRPSAAGTRGETDIDRSRAAAPTDELYAAIKGAGVDFFVYLPEGMLYPVQVLAERDPGMYALCCTREDEGVAIASGAHLGGRSAAVVFEGTGIGMSASALAGLITRQMPILIVSSHSAALGIRKPWDEIAMLANEPVLRSLGISVAVLDDRSRARVVMADSVGESGITGKPCAVVLPPMVMDPDR